MKFTKISMPEAMIQAAEGKTVYLLKTIDDNTTLRDLREADLFFVEGYEDPASVEIPAEEPAQTRRTKTVDHEKIIALASAGWKTTDIAREVGCSEQSVRNHIAKETGDAG